MATVVKVREPGDPISETITAGNTNLEVIRSQIINKGMVVARNWCITITNTGNTNPINTFSATKSTYQGGAQVADGTINAITSIAVGVSYQIELSGKCFSEIQLSLTSTLGTSYSIEVTCN